MEFLIWKKTVKFSTDSKTSVCSSLNFIDFSFVHAKQVAYWTLILLKKTFIINLLLLFYLVLSFLRIVGEQDWPLCSTCWPSVAITNSWYIFDNTAKCITLSTSWFFAPSLSGPFFLFFHITQELIEQFNKSLICYIRTMVVTVAHIMCANNWNRNFKSHFSSLKLWFQVTILVVAHIICTYVLCATKITLWTKDALAFFNYLSLFEKRDYCCWLIISFHFFFFFMGIRFHVNWLI